MNIKISTVVIWVILFSFYCTSTISIPIDKKGDRRRNDEDTDQSVWKTVDYSHGKESSLKEFDKERYQIIERPEQSVDLKSAPRRRPAREDYNSNHKSELPFSLEEFQTLLRKYLDLFPQLRGNKKSDEDSDDFTDLNKRERDNPIHQSGNLNVYIKGNVQIKGSVHINTSGNGNGLRNTHDSKGKDDYVVGTEPQDADTVDIIGPNPEDPNSDVVIIPRNNYGNKISPPRASAKLPTLKLKHRT